MSADEPGSPSPFGKPSPTLVIAVVVVVFLAVAAVVTMLKPSGDQGQNRDLGPQAAMPSAPPRSPQEAPTIDSAVNVSFEPGAGSAATLRCTVTLTDAPQDRTTVVHLVLGGKGVGPVPLLHPGEGSVDGVVRAAGGPPGTFVVTQQLASASGRYSCEVVTVMTAAGEARLGGRTRASTSV